jgi:pimeloyl-ACP methyl ester carboxylesterase
MLLTVLKRVSYALYGGYLHEWLTAQAFRPDEALLQKGEWSQPSGPRFEWYRDHIYRRLENERATFLRAVASTLISLRFDGLECAYAALGRGAAVAGEVHNDGQPHEDGNGSDTRSSNSSLVLPVLALWGEQDGIVPCDECGLRALVPQARVRTWPGKRHMLPVEVAEEVAREMLAFWESQ